MTEDNLYFGRSKYAVLPESRNDWVNENLLAFSKLQKFCQYLITLQLLYLSCWTSQLNPAKTCLSGDILLKGVQWIHFLFCKMYIETKVEGRFYEETYLSLNTYVSFRTDTSISLHVLESSTVKLCKRTFSTILGKPLVIFMLTPS